MGKEKLNFSETVFYYICIIIDVSNENIFTFASSGYSTLTFFSSYVVRISWRDCQRYANTAA